MSQYLLACDEGTSSARSVLFDREGYVASSAQIELQSTFPQDGWVEQDANAIWAAQRQSVAGALEQLGTTSSSLHAVGITNQRETTLVWDRSTGEPVGPAITWQCRRTANQCAAINQSSDAEWMSARTGLKIDPYFSATKLRWILDSDPDLPQQGRDGELAFGTVDSWLMFKLTDGRLHAIDRTNASRTLLMDLQKGAWDDELLGYFDIPREILPTIAPSSGEIGYTAGDVLGVEIPIAGVAGDQQAALVGQGCTTPNSAKLTYGTGAFLLVHTGQEAQVSKSGLLSTTAASLGDVEEFALEGSVFSAGSAIQWLRDNLGILAAAAESEDFAMSVQDNAGVFLIPAFEGLGAPHWSANARGALVGLSRSADRRHIVRAALESIALQSYDLIEALESDTGNKIEELRVDGGAAANDFLLQFQADLLDRPVVRPRDLESTARGAANLAAAATDFWFDARYEVDRRFEPNMSVKDRRLKLEGWRAALDSVLSGISDISS
ncbi:MAG: glycerol kinase GlpK [Gammaproteobacteria bacterium]|nr:glycerol kinase GlpK [Gammaproteobacteria bacterium]